LKRNTVFTEGTLITQDYDKLNFILNSFSKLDLVLLEQLFYKNNRGNSPLHIAVKVNNTRMVNLILQYLSLISNSGINVIKDIFKDLIDYKDFTQYLQKSPFQTL
jgi:ankyrin repeat protein